MATLVTFAHQQTIKEVSKNNQKRFEQIIKEVEELELNKLLGYVTYQQIAASPETYGDLLNGSVFTDCNGISVSHKGLKYVLCYLNYATYIQDSQVNDTFSGMVQKTRDDSEHLSSGKIKNLQQHNREIALTAFDLVKKYMIQNINLFPNFICTNSSKQYTPKFKGIKNTY